MMEYSEANPSDYCSMWHVSGSENGSPRDTDELKVTGGHRSATNHKLQSPFQKKKKSALPSEAESRAINKL